MAKEKINVVRIDTDPAKKSLKDLRKELMDIRNEMANLEEGSDAFLEMAQKGGELQHQISEIGESIRGASSDFGDMVGNVSNVAAGLVGAFNAVAGGLQAMGVESEALDETIARMQGLMAVVQGLGSIDTAIKSLDKLRNSITATSGAAKALKTVLQPKVFLAITAVIAALTAAWNLWGDSIKETFPFLGKTTKQLEEEKKAAEAAAEAKRKQAAEEESYRTKVGTAIQGTLSSYKLLQAQYKRLQTDYQKMQWIKNNKDEFDKLGISVKNLKDAEDKFVNNTDAVVQALIKRAIATAKQQQLAELAAKYTEAKVKAEQDYETKKVSAYDEVSHRRQYSVNDGMFVSQRDGKWYWTAEGAQKENEKLRKKLYAEVNEYQKQMNALAEEIADEMTIDTILQGINKGVNGGTGGTADAIVDDTKQKALDAIDIEIESIKRKYNIESKAFKDNVKDQKSYYNDLLEQEKKRLELLEDQPLAYAKQLTVIKNLETTIAEIGTETTETTETVDEELEKLKQLAEYWKEAIQTPQEWYNQELAALNALKDAKLLTDKEYARAKEQIDKELADREKQLNSELVADKKEKMMMTLQVTSAGLNAIGSIMSELANNENAETKESFEKQKKLQIGAATMSMLTGIINAWTSAMALPSPWNFIQAGIDTAATAALGAIQINKIKQQQFGGTGSTPGTSSGATAAMIVPPVQYSNAVQGANTEGAIRDSKVYVTETDIKNTMNKVSVQENENIY
jgi:hypothetical protein